MIVIQPQSDTVYVPSYDPGTVYGSSWPYPSYPPYYAAPPAGYYFGTALATGMAFAAGAAVVGGLWGWASPGWGGGYANVNVNQFNTINANRWQINSYRWGGGPGSARAGTFARAPGGPVGPAGRSQVSLPGHAVRPPTRPGGARGVGGVGRCRTAAGGVGRCGSTGWCRRGGRCRWRGSTGWCRRRWRCRRRGSTGWCRRRGWCWRRGSSGVGGGGRRGGGGGGGREGGCQQAGRAVGGPVRSPRAAHLVTWTAAGAGQSIRTAGRAEPVLWVSSDPSVGRAVVVASPAARGVAADAVAVAVAAVVGVAAGAAAVAAAVREVIYAKC